MLSAIGGCAIEPPAQPQAHAQPALQQAETPSADLALRYSERAAGEGRAFRLDPDASSVRIYVFRGGKAASVGHNHVISAAHFEGYAYLPPGDLTQAAFDLEFPLQDLIVDDAQARKQTAGSFEGELPADAIKGTTDHMLGNRGLDVAHFPFLKIQSLKLTGEMPQAAAEVRIFLHGQSHDQCVALDLSTTDNHLEARGALVLKQSDYGLTPYSVLGGLLAVQDAIVIRFKMVGTPMTAK